MSQSNKRSFEPRRSEYRPLNPARNGRPAQRPAAEGRPVRHAPQRPASEGRPVRPAPQRPAAEGRARSSARQQKVARFRSAPSARRANTVRSSVQPLRPAGKRRACPTASSSFWLPALCWLRYAWHCSSYSRTASTLPPVPVRRLHPSPWSARSIQTALFASMKL